MLEHLLFRSFGSKAALIRELLAALDDLFVQNRGLVMTLLTADAANRPSRPRRDVFVDERVQATLHGFLHRGEWSHDV